MMFTVSLRTVFVHGLETMLSVAAAGKYRRDRQTLLLDFI